MARARSMLTFAFPAAAVAALAGCAHNQGGSRAVTNGTEYTVVIENDSRHDVEAMWSVANVREGDAEPGKGLERPLGLVRSHDTVRDTLTCMSPMSPPGEPPYTQIVRVRLTMPAATWQDPAQMWWEVIGPLPTKFAITEGPGPDGFTVRLTPIEGTIEAVPRQYWGSTGAETK